MTMPWENTSETCNASGVIGYTFCPTTRGWPLPIALSVRLIVHYLAYCMSHHATIALRTLYAFDKAHDLIYILQGY